MRRVCQARMTLLAGLWVGWALDLELARRLLLALGHLLGILAMQLRCVHQFRRRDRLRATLLRWSRRSLREVAVAPTLAFHVKLLIVLFLPRSELPIDIVVDSLVGYIHMVRLLLRGKLLLIIGVADGDNLIILLH